MGKRPKEPQEIFDANTRRAEAIAWLIVAGLAIDIAVLVGEQRPLSERIFQGLADLFIVGGVAGELFFERKARVAGDTVQAEARKAVAEANARVAEAQVELARLRKQMGPRHIDMEAFKKSLEGKPKARVGIVFPREDGEAWQLALEFRDALRGAAWEVSEPQPIAPSRVPQLVDLPSTMGVGGQPTGVTVVARSVSYEEAMAFSNRSLGKPYIATPFTALGAAILESLGTASSSAGGPGAPADDSLRIVVGPKP